MSLEHSPARGGGAFSVADPSFTVDQFCKAENISKSMLYRAWKEGWGPQYYLVGISRRITHRARIAWHQQCETTTLEKISST